MEILSKEKCEELILANKDNLFIVGSTGGNLLRNGKERVSGYIAFSEDEAKAFCQSISDRLPEDQLNFKILKIKNVEGIQSLGFIFDSLYFNKVVIINHGLFLIDYLLDEKKEIIDGIIDRLNDFNDLTQIYTIRLHSTNNVLYKDNALAFYLDKEKASSDAQAFDGIVQQDPIVRLILEKLLNPLQMIEFDGERMQAINLIDALKYVFERSMLSKDDTLNLLKNHNIYMCAATDDSGAVLSYCYQGSLFTSIEEYEKTNKSSMTHPIGAFKFNFSEFNDSESIISVFPPNTFFVFFDTKVHCRIEDFVQAILEMNK